MQANFGTLAEQMGGRVQDARCQSGLSLTDVAQVLGIPAYNLAAAERGELKLATAQIADLCDLFDKKPSWFFDA